VSKRVLVTRRCRFYAQKRYPPMRLPCHAERPPPMTLPLFIDIIAD
jgi:hypothetical protein